MPQETLNASVFHSIKEKINITITYSIEVKIMAERGLLSGTGMMLLAAILAIVLLILPGIVLWIAWLAVIILFLGGIAALFTR